jgi:hypothetical protein
VQVDTRAHVAGGNFVRIMLGGIEALPCYVHVL